MWERNLRRASGSVDRASPGAQGTVTRRDGIAPRAARGSPASVSEYGPVAACRDAPKYGLAEDISDTDKALHGIPCCNSSDEVVQRFRSDWKDRIISAVTSRG